MVAPVEMGLRSRISSGIHPSFSDDIISGLQAPLLPDNANSTVYRFHIRRNIHGKHTAYKWRQCLQCYFGKKGLCQNWIDFILHTSQIVTQYFTKHVIFFTQHVIKWASTYIYL